MPGPYAYGGIDIGNAIRRAQHEMRSREVPPSSAQIAAATLLMVVELKRIIELQERTIEELKDRVSYLVTGAKPR